MTLGGMTGQRLMLLVAVLATFVVIGCWDNKHAMEKVLAQGYETVAQVTGAQYQRKLPFALDGWRPRFVEQDISVDLKWQGKNGTPREHRKVPISESFAQNIVSGDQVKLIALPARVTDSELDVPVILPDSSRRLASLQSWIETAGYVALGGWAAFAALALVAARRAPARGGGAPTAPTRATADLPPRRTLLGLGLLLVGGFMAFKAWSEQESYAVMIKAGTEATADIIAVLDMPRKQGDAPSYAVRLSWKDGKGAVHHFGPTHISERYWKEITRNGELAVKQTAIRYRPDDLQARPLILADAPEQGWQVRFGLTAGLIFLLVGAGSLASALRHAHRRAVK